MRKVTKMEHIGAILVSSLMLLGTYVATAQDQWEGRQDSSEAVVHHGKTLNEWVELLKGEDAEARLRAARVLIEIGRPAYPALSEVLTNPDEATWEHTVEAFVKIGEPAVPASLAAIYMERSGDLRHNGGVAAIQQMGEAAHPALKHALRDDDQMVRFAAITALRVQVSSPAKDATIKVLAEVLQSHKDVPIRVHAAEAIGYAGLMTPPRLMRLDESVDALTRALNDPDDDVKGMAASSIVRLRAWRGKDVVPALIKALKSDEEMMPYFAVEALGQLGPAAEEAIPALLEMIKHDDFWFVADRAAEALGKIGPAAVPLLLEALNNSNEAVRAHAAEALGGVGDGGHVAIPKLIAALKHDEDAGVRAAAARALGEMAGGNAEAVSALIEALSDSDRNVRGAAVRALGRVGSKAKAAVAALVALLDKVECNEAIYRTFGAIGPDAKAAIPVLEAALPADPIGAAKALGRIGPASVPTLIKGLKHDNAYVRSSSALALRYLGPDASDAVPALIEVVETDEDARNPAIQALGAIGQKAAPAVPALVKVLGEGDDTLQYWALDALREIGPGARGAKDAVAKAMLTDDRERRWDAATALIAVGEVSEDMSGVLNALKGDKAHFSRRTIETLIAAGPAAKSAAPTLLKTMNDDGAEPYLRIACAKALPKITPEDKRSITFLRGQLGKSDGPLALTAAFALVELGEADEAVVETLKPGLTSGHPGMLVACAGALARVESQREAAVRLLLGKLREKDKEMRVAVALALAEAGVADPEAISILGGQLRREDGSGRDMDAIRALAAIAGKDKRAQAILTEALHHETDAVREAARTAVGGTQK